MKEYLFLYLFLLFIISNSSSINLEPTELLSNSLFKYIHINPYLLKKVVNNKNFYIIDTRDTPIMAEGYIQNSLLIPIEEYFYVDHVVPEKAHVILITDEKNYKSAIDNFEELGKYKLYGYCLYDEIVNSGLFNLKKVEYDENTKESIQKIIENKGNIIDIREIEEYKETGVIKEAKLIPLSTFLTNYGEIPNEGNVYVYCRRGIRATIGMSFAKRAGFKNNFIIMKGGMEKAIEEKYPLVDYEG